ncbi:unnamed protein product [Amoebophrya sp. A120]|nr:unnamed protein product [Amoebophrya sp. A120]|eukprot:GSA120T00018658001.1
MPPTSPMSGFQPPTRAAGAAQSAVLYIFRKSDLRLSDSRGIEKARSFGLPVCFVACLDKKREWSRFGNETKLPACGPLRRQFYKDCFDDIEQSLQTLRRRCATPSAAPPAPSKSEEPLLWLSELDLPSFVEKFGDHFAHIVCTRERGSYEEKAEKSAERIAKRHKATKMHLVTDDTLIAEENFPFRPLDGSFADGKKPVLKDQYTSFRQVVEQCLTKDRESNTVPAWEFCRTYCPAVARSLAIAEEKAVMADVAPRCLINNSNGNRDPAPLQVVSLRSLFGDEGLVEKDSSSSKGRQFPVNGGSADAIWAELLRVATMEKTTDGHQEQSRRASHLPEATIEDLQPGTKPSYTGGERAALQRLKDYFWNTHAVATYKKTRNDSLGKYYSTKFSMYSATGCVSPRTIVHELALYEDTTGTRNESTYWVVFELLWRDFLHFAIQKHQNYFFYEGGLTGRTRKWDNDVRKFNQWVLGQTGFPFVDAQMRELRKTGFMSNRGRQNVASFLVFTLKIDWRWGAEYFEHALLDHDVAANYGNWITIAGVGFQTRDNVFNVVKQSKQYEAEGKFMEHWIWELKEGLEVAKSDPATRKLLLHTPWEVVDSRIKPLLPDYYVNPIVDAKKTFFYDKNEDFSANNGSSAKGKGKKGKRGSGNRNDRWTPNGFHGMDYHDSNIGGSSGGAQYNYGEGGPPAQPEGESEMKSKRTKWRQKP